MADAYVMANEIFDRLVKDNYHSNRHLLVHAQPFSIYNKVDAYKSEYIPTLFLLFKAALFRIVLDSKETQEEKEAFETLEQLQYRRVVPEELDSMKLHVQKIIEN